MTMTDVPMKLIRAGCFSLLTIGWVQSVFADGPASQPAVQQYQLTNSFGAGFTIAADVGPAQAATKSVDPQLMDKSLTPAPSSPHLLLRTEDMKGSVIDCPDGPWPASAGHKFRPLPGTTEQVILDSDSGFLPLPSTPTTTPVSPAAAP
jgi:hypothetical protein